MFRWPIQVVALCCVSLALYYCAQFWRTRPLWRPHLAYILVWLCHQMLFAGVLLFRVIMAGGDVDADPWILLWANIVYLQGAIALMLTLRIHR